MAQPAALTVTEPATPAPGVHLYTVIDRLELAAALEANLVREQTHPHEPLAILNYTALCPITPGAWNRTTRACRGLIYRTDTGRVVARGFNKFMNYGQDGADPIALDARVYVTDKADGSLGIIYPLPSGGWAVATRGSFASEQAIHATAVLNERYPDYRPLPGVTTLVEIVFPQNRIVLDYGSLDDLILLGGVVIESGDVYPTGIFTYEGATRVEGGRQWTGPVTTTFTCRTLAEALALEPRENAEGVVVRCIDTGAMIKIKQADYVELHRLVTGMTARTIWQHLVDGKPLDELIAPLPDEFHAWVRQVADEINRAIAEEATRLGAEFVKVVEVMPVGWTPEMIPGDRPARAAFAKVAAQHPDSWALFAMLDGRNILPELLKRAQPAPFLTPAGRTYTEETA